MSLQFSSSALKQIEEIKARYPTNMAACLPVLWLAQETFGGWLSVEVQDLVAKTLDLPPSHVHGVVTFYTMFNRQPVGHFHIQVCTNTSCQLCGGFETLGAFEQTLGIRCGETTPDGLFTLTEVECLAACGTAPAVQINDRYFEPVTADDVPGLVAALKQIPTAESFADDVRQPLPGRWEGAESFLSRRAAEPSYVSSVPREKREKIVTQHFGNAQAKEIDTYERAGGYAALRKALKMSPQALVEEVKRSNLRGRVVAPAFPPA